MHRLIVNPQIPHKHKSTKDRITGTFSDECEARIVQDQVVFIWILSTISESFFPRVLVCKHAFEVWDKIQRTSMPK